MRVVLKRTVVIVGDWQFDNLSRSHLHSHVKADYRWRLLRLIKCEISSFVKCQSPTTQGGKGVMHDMWFDQKLVLDMWKQFTSGHYLWIAGLVSNDACSLICDSNWTGLEPGPPDPESSTLTIRPPHILSIFATFDLNFLWNALEFNLGVTDSEMFQIVYKRYHSLSRFLVNNFCTFPVLLKLSAETVLIIFFNNPICGIYVIHETV